MGLYEIKGEYPNKNRHRSVVAVEDQRDAIAIAQGLRKVTTIKRIAVYAAEDGRCVFYDELKIHQQ